jgi:thermitase
MWGGSSRGRAVDVTAPGESVWRAGFDPETKNFTVAPGTGTSFAVATVAGVAALWLAHHGRNLLIQRYGAEKIPFIFNQILRSTCIQVNDPTWIPGQYGAGLVDAEAFLAAPLPNTAVQAVLSPALYLESHVSIDHGGLPTFAHLFERSLAATPIPAYSKQGVLADEELWITLAGLLRIPPIELPQRLKEVGQELAFHLAVNPPLYRLMETAIARQQASGRSFERARERVSPDENVAMVRAALNRQPTSPMLRALLETSP